MIDRNRWPHRRCDYLVSHRPPRRTYAINKANAGYNDAEYEQWLLVQAGRDHPAMMRFTWKLHASTLHKANLALDRVQQKTIRKIGKIGGDNG